MQLPSRLQTEIVDYLWLEKQGLPKPPKITNDSPKNDIVAAAMARGVQLGMDRAITIINNWNKKNKGKVVAYINSTNKEKES